MSMSDQPIELLTVLLDDRMPLTVYSRGVVGVAAETDAFQVVLIRRHHSGQDAQQLERAAADNREVFDLLGRQNALRARRSPSESLPSER